MMCLCGYSLIFTTFMYYLLNSRHQRWEFHLLHHHHQILTHSHGHVPASLSLISQFSCVVIFGFINIQGLYYYHYVNIVHTSPCNRSLISLLHNLLFTLDLTRFFFLLVFCVLTINSTQPLNQLYRFSIHLVTLGVLSISSSWRNLSWSNLELLLFKAAAIVLSWEFSSASFWRVPFLLS